MIESPMDGNHGAIHPKASDYVSNGIPFIMANDLVNGKINYHSCAFITETQAATLRKGFAKPGDVLLTHKATIGRTAIVLDEYATIILTPQVTYYRVIKGLNRRYLKYYFDSSAFQQLFSNWAGAGSTRAYLGITAQRKLPIIVPPIEIQDAIADICGSLDDKIELNNKINENLERQIQAIYQKWFGDASTAKALGTLSDICSYSKNRVAVSDLNISTYFSTENMLPGKAGPTEASSLPTTQQTTGCQSGDTLVSNIRPYFKKIVYCHEKCGCSTDVLCFVPVHPKYSAYLYSTLYADRFFDFMVAGSKGTKMPRGDKQQIMTYPVTLPTDTELERFNSVAVPILTQIQNNRNENKRLSLIRDTMLPKLISGEIYI